MSVQIPRVVIAGLGGDSGKTLVSCGLLAYCKDIGKNPLCFKKGPDFIDSAWLALAAGKKCSNLDTFMIGIEESKEIFFSKAAKGNIAIIEGNRGLFDGLDSAGTHSTANLAKILGANVILVVDGTKVTRTLAAMVLGCKMLDSSLNITGVILNNVSGKRHARVAVESIEQVTGIPVIGVIKRYKDINLLPSRHLGLVTPAEHKQAKKAIENSMNIVKDSINFKKFFEIANKYNEVNYSVSCVPKERKKMVKIGYFMDRAFSFYYPENLEALEDAGAELVEMSAISDDNLDNIDGLYVGGGFPETNLRTLAGNKKMMNSVKIASDSGMPIYAECGGLMYLSESITWGDEQVDMCGVLPFNVKMNVRPGGHGYVEAIVDKENDYFQKGDILKGHEFHYSSIVEDISKILTVLNIKKGRGAQNGRDGFLVNNTFASYMHIHSASAKNWANKFVINAEKFKKIRNRLL